MSDGHVDLVIGLTCFPYSSSPLPTACRNGEEPRTCSRPLCAKSELLRNTLPDAFGLSFANLSIVNLVSCISLSIKLTCQWASAGIVCMCIPSFCRCSSSSSFSDLQRPPDPLAIDLVCRSTVSRFHTGFVELLPVSPFAP